MPTFILHILCNGELDSTQEFDTLPNLKEAVSFMRQQLGKEVRLSIITAGRYEANIIDGAPEEEPARYTLSRCAQSLGAHEAAVNMAKALRRFASEESLNIQEICEAAGLLGFVMAAKVGRVQ